LKQEKMTPWYSTTEVEKKWYVVDASGKVLGRLATEVACIIRGKRKPEYSPNADTGDFVVVINADKVIVTGKRAELKVYKHHSGYPGRLKEKMYGDLIKTKPEFVIEHAVKGMLPKTRLGKKIFHHLKVYRGSEHPHSAQKPELISI